MLRQKFLNLLILLPTFTSDEDVIGLAGLGIGFADITLTQQENDVSIGTDGNNLALLENVNSTDLSADDFAFG